MEMQNREVDLLADDELDAVAGGRMKLPSVGPQGGSGSGGGAGWQEPDPNFWALYNSIAHNLY